MSHPRPSVLFVMPRLRGGGAERVVTTLCNGLAAQGVRTGLVVFRAAKEDYASLHSDVSVYTLGHGARQPWTAMLAIARLYRLATEYRVIVSGLEFHTDRVVYRLGRLCQNVESWAMVHIDLGAYTPFRRHTRRQAFVQAVYPRFRGVVCVSEGVKRGLQQATQNGCPNAHVVHNPLPIDHIRDLADAEPPIDRPYLVSVGRLSPQKDHRTLFAAYRELCTLTESVPDLVIVGDGPLRDELIEYAASLNLTEHVHFVGYAPNPYPWIAQARALVLSSVYEGLGMVLMEAMALETPVVSTDCPSGPAELIGENARGLLAPMGDPQALAHAMLTALECEYATQMRVQRAVEFVRQFDTPVVVQRYMDLLFNR